MRAAGHLSDVELVSHHDGELTGAAANRVAAHLRACEGCRSRAEDLRGAATELTALMDPREAEAIADRVRARLRERLAVASTPPAPARWLRPAVMFGAAAAVILAAVLLVPGARRSPGSDLEPGALPIRALTPGAARITNAGRLCSAETASVLETAEEVRAQVLRDYHVVDLPRHAYELDFLITPELGGSPERRNLWPQRYDLRVWNARVKDQLEDYLAAQVCAGTLDLQVAQRDIATDWIAAYRKYFHRQAPAPAPGQLAQALSMPPSLLPLRWLAGPRAAERE